MKRGALCRLVCVYHASFTMLRESAIRKLLHTIFHNTICTVEQRERERQRFALFCGELIYRAIR